MLMSPANESGYEGASPKYAYLDRQLFVHNLGELLAQTRENIVGAALDEAGFVHVKHSDGRETCVEVFDDCYLMILRKVVNRL